MSYTYSSLFNQTMSSGKECNEGKKKCGVLDIMNNTMCIDKDKECPINLILLSNSSIPPSEYKYIFSHISFSDGSYLHFTNEAIYQSYILYFDWRRLLFHDMSNEGSSVLNLSKFPLLATRTLCYPLDRIVLYQERILHTEILTLWCILILVWR